MHEHLFCGIHIIGELYGVEPGLLNNEVFLKEHLTRGIFASGAHLCSWQVKKFEPEGVTLLGLLSESHVSVHTYPAYQALFFDAFTCGASCDPEKIAQVLAQALKPSSQHYEKITRGTLQMSENCQVAKDLRDIRDILA